MNQDTESTAQPPRAALPGPTREERTRVVRRLQTEALQHTNAKAANLGLVNGDMFAIAHLLSAAVLESGIDAGPARLEMLLKYVRQIERTSKVVHEIESKQEANRDQEPVATALPPLPASE